MPCVGVTASAVGHGDPSLRRIASREICKLCYHVNAVGFSVPDQLWASVVPEHIRERVVCLACFTRLADEKLIAWDRDIQFWPVSLVSHLGCFDSGERGPACVVHSE